MKINLREDEDVIQDEPADATVDLKDELAIKIRSLFNSWDFNKEAQKELDDFIAADVPGYRFDPFYNLTINNGNNGEIIIHVTPNIRVYHEVSAKPTEASKLVIPKETFIKMIRFVQIGINKHIPELSSYDDSVRYGIFIKVYDTDVYFKETFKGTEFSSGLTSIKDFNKDIETTFMKNMTLGDFVNCNIEEIFTLKHDIILSDEYRYKRNALIRKIHALFKHYRKGTFQGKEYELESYNYHVYDKPDKFRDLTDEDVPVLLPTHIIADMEFRGNITIDGNTFRQFDLKQYTNEDSPQVTKDANKYAEELSKYLKEVGKSLSIRMSLNAY